MAAMSDFSVVWLKQLMGPCVLCGVKTGVGAVGWHQADPIGPVCDTCMLERERTLGDLLRMARAQGNGGGN